MPKSERVAIEAVAELLPARQSAVFGDGQRGDVTDAAFFEVAGGRMMFGMRTAPIVVGREGQDTEQAAGPVINRAAGEEGAVAAVMLDDEEAQQEGRGRHDEHKARPEGEFEACPGTDPEQDERHKRDAKLEARARQVGLAIGIDDLQPGLGIGCRLLGHQFVAIVECSAHRRTSDGWIRGKTAVKRLDAPRIGARDRGHPKERPSAMVMTGWLSWLENRPPLLSGRGSPNRSAPPCRHGTSASSNLRHFAEANERRVCALKSLRAEGEKKCPAAERGAR